MHANTQTSAAEIILQRRWRELQQSQQQAAVDECQMAETVLRPQPGAFELAGGMSLTELQDFVPSDEGLAGQWEQALHQLAVMAPGAPFSPFTPLRTWPCASRDV